MWDDDVIFYRRNRKYYGDLRINGEYVPDRYYEEEDKKGKPMSKWKMEYRRSSKKCLVSLTGGSIRKKLYYI